MRLFKGTRNLSASKIFMRKVLRNWKINVDYFMQKIPSLLLDWLNLIIIIAGMLLIIGDFTRKGKQ